MAVVRSSTPSGTKLKTTRNNVLGPAFIAFLSLALVFNLQYPAPPQDAYAICSKSADGIYTVDAQNARTQCILVQGARIADSGLISQVETNWVARFNTGLLPWSRTPSLDVRYIPDQSIIVPGLSDSHGHLLEYGTVMQLPLEGTASIQETVARIREYILLNPDVFHDREAVITGGGWDHTNWADARYPTSNDLESDPIIRGRPVLLQSKDCHAMWLSAKVVQDSQPLPGEIDGGTIFRDVSGWPTGVFLDNAQDLIQAPPATKADYDRRFDVAVRLAHQNGLTSIHDAGLKPESMETFKRRVAKGPLPLRIYAMTFFNPEEEYWGNSTDLTIGTYTNRLTSRSVKIFADGALRTGGSALHEPYADKPHTRGFMRIDPDILYDWVPKFLRDGWQVNIHAIGDRANEIILDVFEASLKNVNVTAARPRLEHAQFMTKEDTRRLGRLGVIASVQPTHAISDMWYAEERLGPKRIEGLYAFRSLLDSGARLVLGTDFPVEDLNPLKTFYAAITRLSPEGTSPHGPGGWFPNQILTRQEALRGLTIDPAYASFTDESLGSLEPGKLADFTILSQDVMTIPVDRILSTSVIATVIEGRAVYGSI